MAKTNSIFINKSPIPSAHAAAFFSEDDLLRAKRDISAWPGYRSTPLISLGEVAERAKVRTVLYKDEGGRFGLGSFKALGGSYAVQRLVEQRVRTLHNRDVPVAEILGDQMGAATGLTVACATDGNHGRSVAWAAKLFGLKCFIYVHANVSVGRQEALEALGATVVRVPGVYDDAVARVAEDAESNGWTVVSDTSYPGYVDIPRDVMLGYTMMLDEILDEAPSPITHVFVQCGVGAMPAAVCAYFSLKSPSTHTVVVEPERAACLLESAKRGRIINLDGDLATIMAGLACGHPSELAWDVLSKGASAFMTAPELLALKAVRMLANRKPSVVAGETGVAGLAGFIAASESNERQALGLDANSVVLLIGTEGATDPDLYRKIVELQDEEVEGFCAQFIEGARRNAEARLPT